MRMKQITLRLLLLLLLPFTAAAQESFGGQLHGNFQLDGQWYLRDEGIDPTGEFYPDERFLGQGYANFVYTDGDFSGGLATRGCVAADAVHLNHKLCLHPPACLVLVCT